MDRYDRQRMIAGWDQDLLKATRVLVIGAGTTGNEVIKNFVLLGLGSITVVDYDRVELVNLSRSVLFRNSDLGLPKASVASQRAKELNEHIEVTFWDRDVVFDIGNLEYGAFDLVLLTVDNLEARLWVNRYCWMNGTPLVDTGLHGLLGNVFLMSPRESACIECSWTSQAYQRLAERYSCLKVGLQQSEMKIPMVISTAAVIGGLAAQEGVRFLHDQQQRTTSRAGTHMSYDGEVGSLFSWTAQKGEECPGHNLELSRMSVLDIDVSRECLIDDARRRVQASCSASAVELYHDKEIVYGEICNVCSHQEQIDPVVLGKYSRHSCTRCSSIASVPKDRSEQLRDGFTFAQLHVPSNHLLRAVVDRDGVVSDVWIRVS